MRVFIERYIFEALFFLVLINLLRLMKGCSYYAYSLFFLVIIH